MSTNHASPKRAPLCIVTLAVAALAGCGREVREQPATTHTGDGAGGALSTNGDAGTGTSSGTGGSGGATPEDPPVCQSPSGFRVGGGIHECPYGPHGSVCDCPEGYDFLGPSGPLCLCDNAAYESFLSAESPLDECGFCEEREVCVNEAVNKPNVWSTVCMPFEVGVLFGANGAGDRVWYNDMSLWTGDPLPEPTTCPNLPGVPLCGGACGSCASGSEVCSGRSPLHPYGVCLPRVMGLSDLCDSMLPCHAGLGCFRFTVQPGAQDSTAQGGRCLPVDACQTIAQGLPGGATCEAP